jgi:5-methyltetrahydrofolate--homocysteine methyltransferase
VGEVCHKLLSADERDSYSRELKASYAKLREEFFKKTPLRACAISDSRGRAARVEPSPRPAPRKSPVLLNPQLRPLMEFIDYSPLFWAWGLKGVYPQILENPEAARLFADAQKMLSVMDGKVHPSGVLGFWTAWREGDDVRVLSESAEEGIFHFLRQQRPDETEVEQPCLCLADFLSPRSGEDSLGGFVVSATDSVDRLAAQFRGKGDDYSALLAKAMGDRIVEAFAEYAHLQARRLWGIEEVGVRPVDCQQSGDGAGVPINITPSQREGVGVGVKIPANYINDLISGKYQSIRPAIGYPSIPDHSEKALLWKLLDAETATGARLTENYAMSPASTVCGLYFHHPQAKYFNVGKIGEDQLADYAARKGWTLDEARKWLSGVL